MKSKKTLLLRGQSPVKAVGVLKYMATKWSVERVLMPWCQTPVLPKTSTQTKLRVLLVDQWTAIEPWDPRIKRVSW